MLGIFNKVFGIAGLGKFLWCGPTYLVGGLGLIYPCSMYALY